MLDAQGQPYTGDIAGSLLFGKKKLTDLEESAIAIWERENFWKATRLIPEFRYFNRKYGNRLSVTRMVPSRQIRIMWWMVRFNYRMIGWRALINWYPASAVGDRILKQGYIP